jgi:UPF0271 protein
MELLLLNVDLGELPEEPEAFYALAHIANVACGGHAGDDASMKRAVSLCQRLGARLGAHPSYPDRPGFGRTRMDMPHDALRARVSEQCSRLAAIASVLGETVLYVKAHGALYHAATEQAAVAEAFVEGATSALGTGITLIGLPRGALAAVATRSSLRFAREGFADRGTRPDGTLVPRGEPGAVLTDPESAAHRALALGASGDVDTVCVHGDSPNAVAIATAVRRALDGA